MEEKSSSPFFSPVSPPFSSHAFMLLLRYGSKTVVPNSARRNAWHSIGNLKILTAEVKKMVNWLKRRVTPKMRIADRCPVIHLHLPPYLQRVFHPQEWLHQDRPSTMKSTSPRLKVLEVFIIRKMLQTTWQTRISILIHPLPIFCLTMVRIFVLHLMLLILLCYRTGALTRAQFDTEPIDFWLRDRYKVER